MSKSGNIIAFDYGTRRIGVAVGNSRIGHGRGIGVVQVRNGEPDLIKIKKLVNEWQPERFVLGLPGGFCASKGTLKKQILKFSKQLSQVFDLPVSYVDETLSTEESNYRMNRSDVPIRKSKKTDLRNEMSAKIILESFFFELDIEKDKSVP